MRRFAIALSLVMLGYGLAHAHADKVMFRVIDSQTIKGQRMVLLQPVLSYNVFGYLKDNSADLTKGETVSCDPSKHVLGTLPHPGKRPADDEVSVIGMDCGASSFDVAGINFK